MYDSNLEDKAGKHFIILGSVLLLLLPVIAEIRNHSSGLYQKNYNYHYRYCLEGSMYASETIYAGETADCEDFAKKRTSKLSGGGLFAVFLLQVFWWTFIGQILFGILMLLPPIEKMVYRIYEKK